MTLINIRNLGVTLSAPLFAQLNLIVNPGDRIVGTGGASAGAAQRPRIAVGAFTRNQAPKGSTCERVYSSAHMPPREPPSIGHPAGRPPGAPEPAWPVFD